MPRVRVIERADEFPQVRRLWEKLASSARAVQPRAAAPTLFQSYAWNEIAARVFAERERPYVVVVESDSGAAIIPGCVRRDSFSLLGEELFDYRDVISMGDPALTAAAWEKVRALGLPVEVKAVRGERDWAEMKPFGGAPYLPASVPIKRNKSLERNLRLLADCGCVLQAQGLKPTAFVATQHPAKAGCSPENATDTGRHGARRSHGDEIKVLRFAEDDKSSADERQGLKPFSLVATHHPAEAGCPRGSATGIAKDEEQRSDRDGIGILRCAQDDKSLAGDRLAALAEALPLDSASPAAAAPLGVTNGMGPSESISQMQIPLRYAPRNDNPERHDNPSTHEIVRRMYELKARYETGSLFRDPLRIEAVVQMAVSAPSEVFTMEHDGELVAAVLTFIDGDVCRFYGTYYGARWARYSPGVSLLYRVIQQAQARGLDFDFMTGEQAYKMRFASGVVPLYVAQVPVMGRIAA